MHLFTFQKADGIASGFYKYPRADEIQLEATRTRVEYYFHLEPNSKQTLKSERNSKTKLYKSEQELSKQPEFESEHSAIKPKVNGSEPWQTPQLRQQILLLMMRQSAAWR